MKKNTFKLLAVAFGSLAAMFSLTGSYAFMNKPEIPAELRK